MSMNQLNLLKYLLLTFVKKQWFIQVIVFMNESLNQFLNRFIQKQLLSCGYRPNNIFADVQTFSLCDITWVWKNNFFLIMF